MAFLLMGGNTALDCSENFDGEETPGVRARLAPSDRSQVMAGPDESIEFTGYDPGRFLVEP
jgi:hypothetical protein